MSLTLRQVLEKNPISNKRKFHLPIKEASALDEIEKSLQDDGVFAELVSTLSLLAADDLKKSVYSIMKRLLSREMSLKFSALGKKGKRNFSELKVYQAVLDAVRISYSNSMEKDIVKHLSSCLATAGDREGGRKVRQSQPRKGNDAFEENI